MTMAFSGLDKDERQASGIDYWEGGTLSGKRFSFGTLYRTIMLENVSVDVAEEGARVKGVLGVSVRPRWGTEGRG